MVTSRLVMERGMEKWRVGGNKVERKINVCGLTANSGPGPLLSSPVLWEANYLTSMRTFVK